MIFLSYIVSVILFGVIHVVVGGLTLGIASNIAAKKGYTATTVQFIGAFVGCFVGALVAPYAFAWFDKTADPIILFVILGISWLLGNFAIAPEHAPSAQRLGAMIGLIVAYAVLSI